MQMLTVTITTIITNKFSINKCISVLVICAAQDNHRSFKLDYIYRTGTSTKPMGNKIPDKV
jgi:hypothetical protein